jgi:polyisoprenoid-binding protein YceI
MAEHVDLESIEKGDDFFDVKNNPYITFKSTKVVQTGPNTFELDGDFTIRGVTKQEKLALSITGKGAGSGTITGTMAFDRKQYELVCRVLFDQYNYQTKEGGRPDFYLSGLEGETQLQSFKQI